jgi:hypothetical protein
MGVVGEHEEPQHGHGRSARHALVNALAHQVHARAERVPADVDEAAKQSGHVPRYRLPGCGA